MERIVCKFGGSSLADADGFRRVRAIVAADRRRRIIVVSAPGKRTPEDPKITDLLLRCQKQAYQGLDFAETFRSIAKRFRAIVHDTDASVDIDVLLEDARIRIRNNPYPEFASSRGEHLAAQIMAGWLGATFVETRDCVFLSADGRVKPVTYARMAQLLDDEGLYVLPGFYGLNERGRTDTLPRGGSDITGAIAARAVAAVAYENWTDVPGVMSADPQLVHDASTVPELTYAELREMAWLGARVVHQEALVPLLETTIPLLVRDTRRPGSAGTRVTKTRESDNRVVAVTADAGFTLVRVEKPGMHTATGVARRVLELFELHDCDWQALPTSLHTMDVLVRSAAWQTNCDELLADLHATVRPLAVHVSGELARVALVGHGIAHRASHAAHVCRVLDGAHVRCHMLQAGATPHSITVAVDEEDTETAVCALHAALIGTTV